jgi:hypothetical protein
VNVADEYWDVTTLFGTISESEATLESQTWYNNPERAGLFAAAVGPALGYPNDFSDSPYFLYELIDVAYQSFSYVRTCNMLLFTELPACEVATRRLFAGSTGPVTFATATRVSAVPLPAGGILLLTGLAAAMTFGKRRRKMAA